MYEYIDTTEKLRECSERIATASWMALDTEFMRSRYYFSKLCLIQVATEDYLACIDPLACDDLSAFATVLYDESITKVLHAAHQDFDIFYQLFKKVPRPLFDTQTAAAVLGIGQQIGYSKLVTHFLGIELDKSQSRTDWEKRPLSSKQLHYAIDDVRYLCQIYPMMLTQLQQLKRLDWLTPSFEHGMALTTYQSQPELMWEKVHGKHRLNRQQLAVLRELAAWREVTAIKRNLPRGWLAPDKLLTTLAQQQPQSMQEMQRLRTSNSTQFKQLKPYYKAWLNSIKKAQRLPETQWPAIKVFQKPNKEQTKQIDLLQLAVHYHAEQHNVSSALIANRKTLQKIVLEEKQHLSDDWRGELVNDSFVALLTGKAYIRKNQQGEIVFSKK